MSRLWLAVKKKFWDDPVAMIGSLCLVGFFASIWAIQMLPWASGVLGTFAVVLFLTACVLGLVHRGQERERLERGSWIVRR